MPLVPPAPAPLPKKWRLLIRVLNEATTYLTAYFDSVHQASEPQLVQWRYLVLKFTRATPVGTVEDAAQIGFNITNITNGDIDTSWTTADYTTCEGHFNEWWSFAKTGMHTDYTLKEYRWYLKQFHPDLVLGAVASPDTKRFADMGPPQRVTPVGQTGTAAAGADLPYQVAMSLTFKTPVPSHWGRVYVPGLTTTALGANGRWANGFVSAWGDYTAELKDDLEGSQFQLVVPTTQVNGKIDTNLQTVADIQVDDIPDVIRRRRARMPVLRYVGQPTP